FRLRVRAPWQIGRVKIPAPLRDVSVHVMKSPAVALLLSDPVRIRLTGVPRVLVEPAVLEEIGIVVAEGETGPCAGAAGVLPLRFARQRVFPPFRETPGCAFRLREILAKHDR